VPSIVDWYTRRGLTPWLSVPDRLQRLPGGVPTTLETLVMVRDVGSAAPDAAVTLAARPDERWLRLYRRDVPAEVLTAVVGGELAFATVAEAAVGRAAVTDAPDGTRWVGLSAVRVAEEVRGRGHARRLCSALLTWGAEHGAVRGYVQVLVDNPVAIALYESMGFITHHHSRYVDARSLPGRSL
jgi:GNAT superfamily N-acetyltransferase